MKNNNYYYLYLAGAYSDIGMAFEIKHVFHVSHNDLKSISRTGS